MASSSSSITAISLHQLASFVSVKLSSTNYLLWRTQMEPLIESQDLLDVIMADPPKETIESEKGDILPNPKFLAWKKTDKLVKSWISGTLSEEALSLKVGLNTSKEVWKTLEDNYAQATKDRDHALLRQIQLCRMGSSSISEYVRKFKNICDNLAAIQRPVSDNDKVFWLSNGLSSKYENFFVSMLSRSPTPSYVDFVNALTNYEL
ncbi:hypothetical protein AAC387_Pa07g1825 [Persea americana]